MECEAALANDRPTPGLHGERNGRNSAVIREWCDSSERRALNLAEVVTAITNSRR